MDYEKIDLLSGRGFYPKPHTLPRPPCPDTSDKLEQRAYKIFMTSLQKTSHGHMDLTILAAIKATAESLKIGSALTAKTLCDLGLRAPRRAFPVSFLDFADNCMRCIHTFPSPPFSVIKICEYWEKTTAQKMTNDDPHKNRFFG